VANVEGRAPRAREPKHKRLSSMVSAQNSKRTPNFAQVSRVLARKIKRARERRKMSVRRLASRARVPVKIIEAIEEGKPLRTLKVAAVLRIGRVLGLPSADLLDTEGHAERPGRRKGSAESTD